MLPLWGALIGAFVLIGLYIILWLTIDRVLSRTLGLNHKATIIVSMVIGFPILGTWGLFWMLPKYIVHSIVQRKYRKLCNGIFQFTPDTEREYFNKPADLRTDKKAAEQKAINTTLSRLEQGLRKAYERQNVLTMPGAFTDPKDLASANQNVKYYQNNLHEAKRVARKLGYSVIKDYPE